jgi:hypothetical protein
MTQASNASLGVSNFNSSGVLSVAGGGTGSSTGYFASGTALVFKQTTAPSGWTKVTTDNDAALRVVSGSVSTGGTVGFTTAFASQAVSGTVGTSGATTSTGSVGSTTLSEAQMPSHQHQGIAYSGASSGVNRWRSSTTNIFDTLNQYLDTTDFRGSSNSHNHSLSMSSHTHTGGTFTGTAINLAVKYVDVIVATKD